MPLSGRNEKRVTMVAPVCLIDAERLHVIEEAMMVNVSSGGARVLTSKRWRPKEAQGLFLLSSEIQAEARVIYCEPLPDGQFCIGLQFL